MGILFSMEYGGMNLKWDYIGSLKPSFGLIFEYEEDDV
jgi:hypothetical protein